MAREQAVVDVDDATGGIDAVIGVVRHHAVPDHDLARCHAQADYPVPLEAHVVENGISCPRGLDATAEIAADGGVSHEHRAPDAMRGLDAIAREPVDAAVLHGKGSALKESDAVEPGAGAVDVEPAQHDMDAGGVDEDAVGPGREHAAEAALVDDGDRLGDGDGAEAAGVEDADLTTGGGLRDGARERLARSRAAAGVGVVTDPPTPRCAWLGPMRAWRRREGDRCRWSRSEGCA